MGDLADATDLELLDSRGIGAVLNLIGPGTWHLKALEMGKMFLKPNVFGAQIGLSSSVCDLFWLRLVGITGSVARRH